MIFRRKESEEKPSIEVETAIERPPGRLDHLLIPTSVLDQSLRGLRGYVPREGLCYWFGRELEPGTGLVMVSAFPRIYSSEYSFELAPGQMSELTTWAQREGLWILAQVHTHPTDEPHSDADEEYSITRRPGFLSVVIPFGAQFSNLRRPQWRCFECDADGQWVDIDEGRLRLFDDVWLPGS
jgi:hypothetical protein